MIVPLKKEEWDFSGLSVEELIPALRWENWREYDQMEQFVATGQAWLEGKLSDKKPPMRKDKPASKRPRQNDNLSEADIARMRTASVFHAFIPSGEFSSLHSWNRKQRDTRYDRWLAGYLRPLLKNWKVPWRCLPDAERHRLCKIHERKRITNMVDIGTWWDAVGHFQRHKPDAGLPLKFDYYEYTSVLFTINWAYGKKRILAAISKMLSQCEPAGIKHWDRRGKKNRDLFVKLERLAMMRLLHHSTLSEIKRLLPDAWSLYSSRKWYDERCQALKEFRSIIQRKEENIFPISWETKAHHSRNTRRLPAK